ncbi:chemotaxis response regulator protein-glutamate methylesterase [Pacificimonas sp. WHA3]|uniref:Protein-glutamate methylesterase/protein-glutamine glutaminase n=1 Tax=Pacificimonas pallii TaxID=2827236 RepID=A0ABS6SFJ8_9SPHN|nr:chemotaxis response regulator protein-glutamate methylesterase [Pacificimonas pallii]MBV7257155.1 chemotaxis response regulator protein-glutamate methylesterase [Pacificimonas pallii]
MTVRTLIVDDSRSMQAIIARELADDPEIEVVGMASDGDEARAKIKEFDPDVVTLDIEMPGMSGLDFLERLMRLRPTPVVMVSSHTARGADVTVAALELGAFDCFDKKRLKIHQRTHGHGDAALADLVRAAAKMKWLKTPSAGAAARIRRVPTYIPRANSLIAVGASTGGVEALIALLSDFPANCPPTVIVQHMSANFTSSFAARLDRLSAPHVQEARPGAILEPGKVFLAPGGKQHLEIGGGRGRRYCRLVAAEKVKGHRPSVDRLFHTVARVAGEDAVGAILTGMGEDGAEGMKAMREQGAFTVGQDEATSVVYGMPAAAFQIGAVAEQSPLRGIARRLLKECAA